MDQLNDVIGLLSIVTGLALSDIGLSLHRLLRRRKDVRWDWLALATAAYVGFTAVRFWFQVWSIRDFPGVTLLFFLTILIEYLVLFLVAAASLPDADDLGPGAIDLRVFQEENSGYIWTLFSLFATMWALHGLYFTWTFGAFLNVRIAAVFCLPILLGVALARARKRQTQQVLFGLLALQEAWWILQAGF